MDTTPAGTDAIEVVDISALEAGPGPARDAMDRALGQAFRLARRMQARYLRKACTRPGHRIAPAPASMSSAPSNSGD